MVQAGLGVKGLINGDINFVGICIILFTRVYMKFTNFIYGRYS